MAEKTNGLSPPQGGGYHRLPQIPTMSRNAKIAQSKNAKFETVTVIENVDEGAVIHIEGTHKVVKINSDGVTEMVDNSPVSTNEEANAQAEGENTDTVKSEKKTRKRGRSSKIVPTTPDNPKAIEKKSTRLSLETEVKVCRKRAKTAHKDDSISDQSAKKETHQDTVAVFETETPKPASSKRAVKTTPKADTAERKGKRCSRGLLAQTDQKTTPAVAAEPPAAEELPPENIGELESSKSADMSLADDNGNAQESSMLRQILQDSKSSHCDSITEQKNEMAAPHVENAAEVKKKVVNKDAESVCQSKDIVSEVKERPKRDAEPKVYYSAAGRMLPRTVLLRESERPSDMQLARLMEGKSNQYDISHPVKWRVGDLLWGHVSGHPWWPGMVSSDPFSGLFTTIKAGNRVSRLYHVQYFGDEAERGWVGESSSMAFEGKQKLIDFGIAQIKVTKDRGKKAKLQQAFCPNQRRKAAWDLAVDEAEDAMTLDKTVCIDKYTFVYEFLPNKKPVKQDNITKGINSSPAPENVEKRGRKRKALDRDADDSFEEPPESKRQRLPASAPSHNQRSRGSREEGSFETYCIKHREFVREEHPEYTGAMVIEALKQQWAVMTPLQRLRYKSKFSGTDAAVPMDCDTPQGPHKRSPRKSRPSLKKMEADGDRGLDDYKQMKQMLQESAVDSVDKDQTSETEMLGRRRKRKSMPAVASEEEISPSDASTSVKSKVSNDSDTNSDFQEECRPRGRPSKNEEEHVLEIFRLNNTAPTKKENLCAVCDETGELVECQGVCQNYFHAACVDMTASSPGDFKCQECLSGEHKCFDCKKADKETKRCAVSQCGKFYHEECVKNLSNARFEGKGFTCPHHTCATCAADASRNLKSVKGRLYRCVRCPTAYHVGDFCIAAGSILLGGYHILCSNHFQPVKSNKHHQRINVSWCFSCSRGGSLVCCETCPAAFHTDCVNLTSMPEDAWYCSECSSGKKPLYGNIIWIKIGNYRWWPAEVCHPRNVPTNIQEMAHSVGEFPARFFGSHDYYWTHQGRVFLFQDGDRGSKDTSASRGLFKMYYKGVNEATEAFKLWKAAKENKEQIEQEKNDRKPAPFKFIKANVPYGNVQLFKPDLSEAPRCECKPDQENPCGSDSECLNRMLMYECNPAVCPAKEACMNRRFQQREYPQSIPYRTESRGWGLKTLVNIKKGQFVNEYVGDLIDEEECKRRIKQAHEDNVTNFYMLTVDKNRIIDAGPKGNNSRFMNHSCEPNLETQKWTVNGDVRVGLFAINDIAAGSELTFNYNLECLGNEKTKCGCGSENCSGFLGVRPKPQTTLTTEKKKDKDGKKKKKKKRLELKKEHEDECFRCGEGGELVMCDKTNCPKVYHLQCLNLAKPPHGKWLCPWHHCDVCGKLASKLCSECPNSFCQQHEQGVITMIKDSLICAEHTDLIQGLAASTSESASLSSSSVDSDDSAESLLPPAPKMKKVEDLVEEDMDDFNCDSAVTKDGVQEETGVHIKIEIEPPKKESVVEEDAKPVESSLTMAKEEAVEAGIYKSSLDTTGISPAVSAPSPVNKYAPGEDPSRRRRSKTESRKRGTVCRTKARYKAQLKAGSASSSPLPGGTSPSFHHLNTDSDNDSGGLVIDLPSN